MAPIATGRICVGEVRVISCDCLGVGDGTSAGKALLCRLQESLIIALHASECNCSDLQTSSLPAG